MTRLFLGDCLDALRQLPDASVDAVVTDPPYGLSFMGKKWDYDVPTVEVWAECLRVLKPGNAAPMGTLPIGTIVHNVELKIGKGGALARSAGNYAQIVGRDQGYVIVRLNSGEQRLISGLCYATVGAVSNPDHMNRNDGKAGRSRWLGRRPHNRGVSMNPVDHPHGGGEGRTSGGRHPVTPWGLPTKGKKTRSNKRTDTFIVSSRHARKKKN